MEKSLLDLMWILTTAALVFVMQGGFACLESGLTRSKNSINVAVKNIADLGIAVVLFWAFGFALMFGVGLHGWIGTSNYLVALEKDPYLAAFFLFQAMFCATAATIVSGAIAERMRFGSYVFITILISGVIYPVYGHWAWGGALYPQSPGHLQALGFVDFAGSTVVHSVGGWISLAAILVVGPRSGRFPKDGPPARIHGHDLPIAILGTILLWFGWFGFNGGSTLAMDKTVPLIIANTAIAAASGLTTAFIVGMPIKKLPDVSLPINGSLAGLVAITANCHAVTAGSALIIGAVGAVLALLAEVLLQKLRIDDAVGAIPVHLVAGIWGTLAVALFGDAGVLGTKLSLWEQLRVQAYGIGLCGAWAFGVGFIVLWVGNRITSLRVTPEEEHVGLNVSEHGASTEILDLFRSLDAQARSGDLTMRVSVEPFTEVGQIAERYNSVMDTLERHVREKEEILNSDLLKSVREGLFIIKPDGSIGPQYSQALIHERPEPTGESIRSILVELLPEEKMDSFNDYLDLLFLESQSDASLLKLNPLRDVVASFNSPDGARKPKHLQFHFQRVRHDGAITHIMGAVTDVSREKELALDLERGEKRSRKQMERLFSVVHVEPELLADFLRDTERDLGEIAAILKSEDMPPADRLVAISRTAHRIKGNASVLNIAFVADTTHDFEEKIQTLANQPDPSALDFLSLMPPLRALHVHKEEIRAFVERLLQFRERFENDSSAGLFLDIVERTVHRLAQELGKRVALSTKEFAHEAVPRGMRPFVQDALVQLIRNSLSHGIEEPTERLRAGKDETGRIMLAARRVEGYLELCCRDDGRGIQLERLREHLIASGRFPRELALAMTHEQLARSIFAPGVSTADVSGPHAGRGIGMEVIAGRVRELGGRITASFRPGKFTQFQIVVPVGAS